VGSPYFSALSTTRRSGSCAHTDHACALVVGVWLSISMLLQTRAHPGSSTLTTQIADRSSHSCCCLSSPSPTEMPYSCHLFTQLFSSRAHPHSVKTTVCPRGDGSVTSCTVLGDIPVPSVSQAPLFPELCRSALSSVPTARCLETLNSCLGPHCPS
jgi:hypothetical protein